MSISDSGLNANILYSVVSDETQNPTKLTSEIITYFLNSEISLLKYQDIVCR